MLKIHHSHTAQKTPCYSILSSGKCSFIQFGQNTATKQFQDPCAYRYPVLRGQGAWTSCTSLVKAEDEKGKSDYLLHPYILPDSSDMLLTILDLTKATDIVLSQ